VPVPWGKLSGKEWGSASGSPWIALHGWLDNCGSFDPLMMTSHFPKEENRIFCLDMPGHGRSSHYPKGMHYSYLDSQQVIRRVAEHFGLSRFSLLGHSMGGGMSMLFTATHPERISRLIMLDIAKPTSLKVDHVVQRTRLHVDDFLRTEAKLDAALAAGTPPPRYSWNEAKQRLIQGESLLMSTTNQ